jgi:VWFA-related protein
VTRPTIGSGLLGAIVASAGIVAMAQNRQVFRAGVDVVTADVSVRAGNNPVVGLRAADFIVTDNGVRQEVEAVESNSLPIDVSFVLDISGSVWPIRDDLLRAAEKAAQVLKPGDRVRVLTAGTSVDAAAFQPASDTLKFQNPQIYALTSIFDALTAALLGPRTGNHRQLVIALTDGFDTMSAMGFEGLLDVSGASEAVMHLFLLDLPLAMAGAAPPPPTPLDTRNRWVPGAGAGNWSYDRVARQTGGRLWPVAGAGALPDGFRSAVEAFRASYVIRYTAKGVTAAGWHEIAVSVNRPGKYQVLARKGYFGS